MYTKPNAKLPIIANADIIQTALVCSPASKSAVMSIWIGVSPTAKARSVFPKTPIDAKDASAKITARYPICPIYARSIYHIFIIKHDPKQILRFDSDFEKMFLRCRQMRLLFVIVFSFCLVLQILQVLLQSKQHLTRH